MAETMETSVATTEVLERANEVYEASLGSENPLSIGEVERLHGLAKGKLGNWRSNRKRLKERLEAAAAAPADAGGLAAAGVVMRRWPLDRIRMRGNARTEFALEELTNLANSIKSTGGELQNVVGYEEEIDGEPWCVLVIGERRLRSYELLRGRGEVVDGMVVRMIPRPSEKDFMRMNLVENTQRVSLKPTEEAAWMREMLALTDEGSGLPLYSEASLAEDIGKNRNDVGRALACLRAPREAREALDSGRVAPEAVALIGSLPAEMREGAQREMVFGLAGPMTVKEARAHVATRYRRDLRRADFDREDGSLTGAGPCSGCEWWGGNRQDVGGKAAVHVCLNPACFGEKQAAAAEREKARIMEEGGEVVLLTDGESEKLFDGVLGRLSPTCGYVDLAAKPDPYFLADGDRNRDSVPTWRAALKDAMPLVHVAWDTEGRKRELAETGPAMVAALGGPYGVLFRAAAAKGMLTREEQTRIDRAKAAVNRAGREVCLEGARRFFAEMGKVGVDRDSLRCVVELAVGPSLKPDDYVFLCEMLEPGMARSEMTGRGFLELMRSRSMEAEELLALLVLALSVRSLRYEGWGPWCEEGPLAELSQGCGFAPKEWRKAWKVRRAAAERREEARGDVGEGK